MRPLRVIELGVNHPHGAMYRTTIANHTGIEFVGAWDSDPERAAFMLASEHVDLPLFDDMEAVIGQTNPDAVLITLPNDMTPDAIVTSAKRGLHIFAEKPSAVSAAAFAPAHEAVVNSQIQFLSGYLRRFSPVATALRDVIADGILGELISAQIAFATTNAILRNATYLAGGTIESVADSGALPAKEQLGNDRHWLFDYERSGGGIMHWLGVHWIDLLRFVTRDEFAHVSATLATRTAAPINVDDVASVTLEAESGLLATVSCAYVLPRGPDQTNISIQGTMGWAVWDGVGPDLHVRSDHSSWRSAPSRSFRFQTDDVPGYAGALGWVAFEQFRAAIAGQQRLPMDVTDALRVLQILDVIQLSGRERRRAAI